MAESGGVAVTITNRDIYDEVVHLKEAVSAMSPQAARLDDHEARIRSVERWKYALPASIGVSVLSVVLAIIQGGGHG